MGCEESGDREMQVTEIEERGCCIVGWKFGIIRSWWGAAGEPPPAQESKAQERAVDSRWGIGSCLQRGNKLILKADDVG